MNSCFLPTDIVLPDLQDMKSWAVIACDQFTSENQYWQNLAKEIGDRPSTLHMMIPEYDLQTQYPTRMNKALQTMEQSLHNGLYQTYTQCYVYVRREMSNGRIRKGIVGMMDLQVYGKGDAPIAATEEIVSDRIGPRIALRQKAPLEFSHILLLMEEDTQGVFSYLEANYLQLPVLYDFDLLAGGGHISGYLVAQDHCRRIEQLLNDYCNRKGKPCFLVGDGNHSVLAAKACYTAHPENQLGRFALAEAVNLGDMEDSIYPIHRLLKEVDVQHLIQWFPQSDEGYSIAYYTDGGQGVVRISTGDQEPVAAFQKLLDAYLASHPGKPDYIHGDDNLINLAKQPGCIGFLMPQPNPKSLFTHISRGSLLPRKAFSLGNASDKRYYLEGRKIK